MVDIEKRRRVMKRSISLGHCICNPKKGCPCDVFKEKDICPCAGERTEEAVEDVKLTSLVEKAGCASKINQNDLKKVLAGLPQVTDPRILVGTNTCDDAGVFLLDDKTALVQTVDVFTPSVDDPYTFGQIAAANSLSDVYAMGGRPLTALSIIAFPIETLSPRIMTQMLRGGADKMREAGTAIVGGHSINDKEPKFGYAVTGVIDPSKIITNSAAQPGDVLILTKPLGVGVISFANQLGKASESALAEAAQSMTELNKTAAEVMIEVGVSAATDVTGFGLLGHLTEMACQSGVSAEVHADVTPIFAEVKGYISQGMISGGIERNMEHSSQYVDVAAGVCEEAVYAMYDPQTSGGLLISVPADKAEQLLSKLKESGISRASIIGRILGESAGRAHIRNRGDNNPIIADTIDKEGRPMSDENSCCGSTEPTSCCGAAEPASCCDAVTEAEPSGGESDARSGFMAFMGTVMSEGTISLRNKELIAVALSLLAKCEPCVKIHISKARSLGISEDEINEAVWMAISFGGAPLMMFYESIRYKV